MGAPHGQVQSKKILFVDDENFFVSSAEEFAAEALKSVNREWYVKVFEVFALFQPDLIISDYSYA
jgi:hypothetical protein